MENVHTNWKGFDKIIKRVQGKDPCSGKKNLSPNPDPLPHLWNKGPAPGGSEPRSRSRTTKAANTPSGIHFIDIFRNTFCWYFLGIIFLNIFLFSTYYGGLRIAYLLRILSFFFPSCVAYYDNCISVFSRLWFTHLKHRFWVLYDVFFSVLSLEHYACLSNPRSVLLFKFILIIF